MNAFTSIKIIPADAAYAVLIAAKAWAETDLLGDIPDFNRDADKLAREYAEVASEMVEEDLGIAYNTTAPAILDASRALLVTRLYAEFDRRDEVVEEYMNTFHRRERFPDIYGYYHAADALGLAA